MDGCAFTTTVGLLLLAISCAQAEQRATFCLTKSKGITPPMKCSKPCAPDILVLEAKSQIVPSCTSTSSTSPWLLNDTATHSVWNNCNLRGSSCLTIAYHDHAAVRLDVIYTCVNVPSIYKLDMCSNIGYVVPSPLYLNTAKYPDFSTITSKTNCTCKLWTLSGSDVKVSLLDMLTSLPESVSVEWNGGKVSFTTVSDEVGFRTTMRVVTEKGPVVRFQPLFPGPAYIWMKAEAQAAGSQENLLLTCNGNLGSTPTNMPKVVPSTCPTTTTTTTTTTPTTTTTTTTPTTTATTTPTTTTTTTPTTTTTTTPTTTTTTTPTTTTTTTPTTTTTTTPTTTTTTTPTTTTTTTTTTMKPTTTTKTTPTTTTTTTEKPLITTLSSFSTSGETDISDTSPSSDVTDTSSTRSSGGGGGGLVGDSGFSIYYLVPVVVVVITIIILVVVIVNKRRRDSMKAFQPEKSSSSSRIKLTSVQLDRNFYLTTGRPKYVLESRGSRLADDAASRSSTLHSRASTVRPSLYIIEPPGSRIGDDPPHRSSTVRPKYIRESVSSRVSDDSPHRSSTMRPKYIREPSGSRASDDVPNRSTLQLSPKELVYFENPKRKTASFPRQNAKT